MVAFSPHVPNPMPQRFTLNDSVVRYEFGRHAIDFSPIFGGPVASDVSTTIFGGGASLFYEVSGLVETGDSATLVIVPRMSHGGLSLWGQIHGDTLSGRWSQNAYRDGARGTFVMVRRPWTLAADSLVRLAVEQDSAQQLESAAAEEAWHRRAGELRVRTYDEAAGRYIEANYWIARQDDEPSDRLFTMVRSDSSGWSPYTGQEPGTYTVELSDYPCGDLTFFADTTYVRTQMPRLTVVITSGQRSELDVRINTHAIRATRSYDNLKGRVCTQPPPTARTVPPERPNQRMQLPERARAAVCLADGRPRPTLAVTTQFTSAPGGSRLARSAIDAQIRYTATGPHYGYRSTRALAPRPALSNSGGPPTGGPRLRRGA
jgi:hypothetical protein